MGVQVPAAGTSTAAASPSQPAAGSEGDDWAAFMDAATASGPAHSAVQPAAAAEDHWDAFQVGVTQLHSHSAACAKAFHCGTAQKGFVALQQ